MHDDQIQGEFEGKTFKHETVKLDGSNFKDCTFHSCAFLYAGGPPPAISGCSFDTCTWGFAEGAANTLMFLSGFYNGGFADLIEQTFHEVRKGTPLARQSEGKKPAGSRTFFGLEPLRVFKVPKAK